MAPANRAGTSSVDPNAKNVQFIIQPKNLQTIQTVQSVQNVSSQMQNNVQLIGSQANNIQLINQANIQQQKIYTPVTSNIINVKQNDVILQQQQQQQQQQLQQQIQIQQQQQQQPIMQQVTSIQQSTPNAHQYC